MRIWRAHAHCWQGLSIGELECCIRSWYVDVCCNGAWGGGVLVVMFMAMVWQYVQKSVVLHAHMRAKQNILQQHIHQINTSTPPPYSNEMERGRCVDAGARPATRVVSIQVRGHERKDRGGDLGDRK